MVLVQKCHFSNFFFLGNIAQENVFYNILKRKNAFLGYKNRSSKTKKIDIFPQGLTHGFGPKMSIFPNLFFQTIYARKIFFTIFQNEKTLFQALKTRTSKSQKIDGFPKGLPMVLFKTWPFLQLFFFGNVNQENVFYNILECKNAFLGYKNKKFKKCPFFQLFFLGNIGQENVFYDILKRTIAFLGYKNKKFEN